MNFKQLNEAFDRLAKQSLNENLNQMKAMVEDDTVDPYDLYDELITYTNDMWVNGVDALIQSTGDKDIELDGQGDVIMLSTSLGYVTWSSDDELQLLVDLVLEAESDKDVEQGVSEFLKSEYNKLAQNINEAWDEELSIKGFYNMFVPRIDSETKEKAANLLYDWYSAEGEEYMPTLSDILDMCDAADDETAKNIVLYALGQTSQSDNFEESVEENENRRYNPPSRPAFPGRNLDSVLQNAVADAVQDYYDTTGVIPTRQEVRDAIEPFIQSLSSYEISESFKRISRYGEFDNGHVIHNDWRNMSDKEAEDLAKQMSAANPNDIYYVAYDNVMNPSSDLRWIAGEPYNYSEVQIKNGKPFIKSVTEDRVKSTKNTKLKEDVFYDWKPNTSFAHIKKIYNDVKKRGYKYVNNELEEMHAAMKKVDAKGYTPEQRKQIRSWSEEIWRANRKNESLNEEEFPKSISDNDNSYPLAFVPTTDVKGKDLTNTLCDVLNKAGIKNCCAKKRAGKYYITVICPSTELGTAKTIIENCGFFKEWLPLNRG